MDRKLRKKLLKGKVAQSGIVVGIVLVLIAIAAVVILWNIFNPLVQEKSKDINVNSLETNIQITGASVFVTGSSKITVQRQNDNNKLDELKFVFYDDYGNSSTLAVSENLPGQLESRTYYFSPIDNFGKINKILVYPVIGGKNGIGNSFDYNKIFEVPSGLVGWFSFDGKLDDSTGNNNGESFGAVNFTNEEGRSSAFFSGGYCDFGNNSVLDLKDEFALSFWIKTDSKEGLILEKGITNPNYKIGINEDGKINFSYTSLGVLKSYESINTISDGKWHNIVITNMMVYFDGDTDSTLSINDVLDTNLGDLMIGEGLNGSLRDIMIFNRSLDMSQSKSIFSLQK